MTRKSIILLVLGFCSLSLALLYLSTRPAIFHSWDFSNTGEIGDTIGGITAPLFNIVGSILIYVSFREQYKANQLQKNAIQDEIKNNNHNKEFQLIESTINTFVSIYNEISFTTIEKRPAGLATNSYTDEEIENKGTIAIIKFADNFGYRKGISTIHRVSVEEGFMVNLNYCLLTLDYALSRVLIYTYDKGDTKYFIKKIKTVYSSFLERQVTGILVKVKEKYSEETFGKEIGDLISQVEETNNEIKNKLSIV